MNRLLAVSLLFLCTISFAAEPKDAFSVADQKAAKNTAADAKKTPGASRLARPSVPKMAENPVSRTAASPGSLRRADPPRTRTMAGPAPRVTTAPVTPRLSRAPAIPAAVRRFSAAELKKFDGKEGRPAYVAVDGIVYDVTASKPWRGGKHMHMHSAGADLTRDYHERAPKRFHADRKVLDRLPKVGVLDEGKGGR